MTESLLSNFLKRFYLLTQKVRLIWALCAVVLIIFGSDFSPIIRSSVIDSAVKPVQQLTSVSNTNFLAQEQSDVLNAADNTSTQIVQANNSGPDGQVKALTTVSIGVSSILGTTTYCGLSLYTGGYACIPDSFAPAGAGTSLGYIYSSVLLNPVSIYKTANAYFNLNALPAGESVIKADLIIWYSSCGNNAYSVTGYATVLNCSSGVSLGAAGAAAIQASKPANTIVLNFQGGSNHALFSSFQLILTYGRRTVDLKANGVDGPITVKGGSNVILSWENVGFDNCTYEASPAWYTPTWTLGQKLPSATGTTVTKIYFESITYRVGCRDSGSGATDGDNVTVNVTP